MSLCHQFPQFTPQEIDAFHRKLCTMESSCRVSLRRLQQSSFPQNSQDFFGVFLACPKSPQERHSFERGTGNHVFFLPWLIFAQHKSVFSKLNPPGPPFTFLLHQCGPSRLRRCYFHLGPVLRDDQIRSNLAPKFLRHADMPLLLIFLAPAISCTPTEASWKVV